jgi:hypothetical protein
VAVAKKNTCTQCDEREATKNGLCGQCQYKSGENPLDHSIPVPVGSTTSDEGPELKLTRDDKNFLRSLRIQVDTN